MPFCFVFSTTESKETTAATGKLQSPTKLKEAMKETEKKESGEQKDGEKTAAKEAVEALNLLAQGKRNMLCGEVPQAVSQLQEASRILWVLLSIYGQSKVPELRR